MLLNSRSNMLQPFLRYCDFFFKKWPKKCLRIRVLVELFGFVAKKSIKIWWLGWLLMERVVGGTSLLCLCLERRKWMRWGKNEAFKKRIAGWHFQNSGRYFSSVRYFDEISRYFDIRDRGPIKCKILLWWPPIPVHIGISWYFESWFLHMVFESESLIIPSRLIIDNHWLIWYASFYFFFHDLK